MLLGDVTIEGKTVNVLRNRHNYNFCSDIGRNTPVHCYGAVIARNGLLVNKSDYVAFSDEEGKV